MSTYNFKERLLNTPFLGSSALWLNEIIKLNKRHREYENQSLSLEKKIHSLTQSIREQKSTNEYTTEYLNSLTTITDNLREHIQLAKKTPTLNSSNTKQSSKELFADNHLLDMFYSAFEDRFRGSEEEIAERQSEYVNDFTINAPLDFSKYPVLDIGCGRGEFLTLLESLGVKCVGLDINTDMVERAKKKGLTALQGDATEYLQKTKSQTLGAITGFHIVEHIPFPALLTLFAASHKSLKKGGFVLFETPNPENIAVGACNFYMDPSHLHPIPPALLAFALETIGFRVEVRRIHPVPNAPTLKSNDLQNWFYGPRDYVVLGYK